MNTSTPTTGKLPQDMIERARAVDLIALAERYTELRRVSAREYAGPCPSATCGAKTDGFHVQADRFLCHKCHPKWGNAIDFMRHYQGLDFRRAVETLTGEAAPQAVRKVQPLPKSTASTDPEWRARAAKLGYSAYLTLLESPEGQPGRDYLQGRGIEFDAWQEFGLGFEPRAKAGRQFVPAIVIPWRAEVTSGKTEILQLKYRFLQPIERKGRDPWRFTTLDGSQNGGLIYNYPMRAPGPEHLTTLVLIEGEFNAHSVWQVSRGSNLEVMSLGGEGKHLPPEFVEYAQGFRSLICWADKDEVALQLKAALPGCVAIKSPRGLDANDLLQRGVLAGFMVKARVAACRGNPALLEALYFDLWDNAYTLQGIDTTAREQFERLAHQVGKAPKVTEAGPGRWRVVPQGG